MLKFKLFIYRLSKITVFLDQQSNNFIKINERLVLQDLEDITNAFNYIAYNNEDILSCKYFIKLCI